MGVADVTGTDTIGAWWTAKAFLFSLEDFQGGGWGGRGGEDGDGAEGIEEGISRNSHMGRGQRGCEGSTSDHSKNGHQPTDQPEERQHKS